MSPEENLLRAIENPAGYWEDRCAAAEDECAVLRKRIDALEAERAEMDTEWNCWEGKKNPAGHPFPVPFRHAPGSHSDICRERRVTPWLPVQETDR
jgi:hypothetical protein